MRLPWTTAHPIPEALRAIVNRATDRQERQRYRNARTLLRALEGWLQTDSDAGGGPLALLLDRLRTVGVLPASPGRADARRAAGADGAASAPTNWPRWCCEDLALVVRAAARWSTRAQVRGAQVPGSGPVLTVRRAIAMLGLDGVRRAALALRAWPGPARPNAGAANCSG